MPLKLLIAEDSNDIADLLAVCARMTWSDCVITVAVDGDEALCACRQEQFDLVLLNVMMPATDGGEVCRRIRADSQVPIIALVGSSDPLAKCRAYDLGADDYLTAPFDLLELQGRFRSLVGRSRPTPIKPLELARG